MTSPTMDAAVRYAERGIAVFPLRPRTKQPYGRTEGLKMASADVRTARERWSGRWMLPLQPIEKLREKNPKRSDEWLLRPVRVEMGRSFAEMRPFDRGFRLDVEIDFDTAVRTVGAGLAEDVLYGSLLGQNALILTLITFLVMTLHRRLRMFPLWQQSVVLLVVFGLAQLLQLWLYTLSGNRPPTLLFLLPALVSALLWPWVFTILRGLSRRFHVY